MRLLKSDIAKKIMLMSLIVLWALFMMPSENMNWIKTQIARAGSGFKSYSQLTSLSDGDIFIVQDVSDPTDGADGTTKYAEASDILDPDNLAGDTDDDNLVDGDIVEPASTSERGTVELATDAEASTGTDTARAVTPSGLAQYTSDNSTSTLADSQFVPISWFVFDGTTDPGALTELNNMRYRDFDDASAEEGEFIWQIPGDLTGSAVKIRAIAVVTNSTTPADGEGVSWGIAACSSGTDDGYDCTVGTEVNSEDTDLDDDAGAQWDLIYFPYIEVTPTGLAAGELLKVALQRDVADADDDYAQDIGLIGVEIKWQYTVGGVTY